MVTPMYAAHAEIQPMHPYVAHAPMLTHWCLVLRRVVPVLPEHEASPSQFILVSVSEFVKGREASHTGG